jgi:galactokinase
MRGGPVLDHRLIGSRRPPPRSPHPSSPSMNASDARKFFRQNFGAEPDAIGSAPGRVNLTGEHTDYNGGQVLPIAIERRTYVAIRARPDAASSRIVSASEARHAEFDVEEIAASGNWWDYMTGVCSALRAEGARLPQFDAIVQSDVPTGSGLSSSAALELATAITLMELMKEPTDLKKLALLAWQVETQFVGVACGVMDQFASALCERGRALHLWCDTLETEQVAMPDAVLIFDTASPRSLRESEFNKRRAECEEALAILRTSNPSLRNLAEAEPKNILRSKLPSTLEKRALHVAEENRRVEAVVMQLTRSHSLRGELLYQSHESLRDKYECSTPELDWFVENARVTRGITGARLTGAGWGGCAIAVGAKAALESLARDITPAYQERFNHEPRTWLTLASDGARVEAPKS